jgi:hypothetical protein
LKGYVSKSGFHLGETSVSTPFELDEFGINIIGPEEVLKEIIEIKQYVEVVENLPKDLKEEDIELSFVHSGVEVVGSQEVVSFIEDNEFSSFIPLTDSFVNHIDSGDNSVLLIYGEADPWWSRRPGEPEKFKVALEENNVEHFKIIIEEQGHGISLSFHPKVENLVQQYILAVANDEELPYFVNGEETVFEFQEV